MHLRYHEELIEYIPLQQGLRHNYLFLFLFLKYLIEYIPLQQGLRLSFFSAFKFSLHSLSIFHYNKD